MHRPARTSLLALALALPACSDSSGPKGITVYDCDMASRYSVGQTLAGVIIESDCTDPVGGARVDFYQLRLAASGPVSVSVARAAGYGTMYVVIIGTGDEVLAGADIAPGQQVAVGGQLDAGTYIIAIGGEVPAGGNSYTLSSSATLPSSGPPFLNCTRSQPYTVGVTVDGSLGTGDCVSPYLTWMDRYDFTLTSPRTVTINLTSTSFDAYLYLFDGAGTVMAENDDFGTTNNARISRSLPVGTYSIGVTSYYEDETGSYVLRAQ